MNIVYTIVISMLINVVVYSFQVPIRYSAYNKIRPVFFNIYKDKEDIFSLKQFNREYSLEHVIPRSLFKYETLIKKDMHNIILYPNKVNTHRSNYKYISDFKIYGNSMLLDEFGNRIDYKSPITEDTIMIKTNNRKLFYPCKKYRGLIARSAMYFLITYPKYQSEILENVIDPYTILTWHHQNPVNKFEISKNKIIKEIQGNDNVFVLNESLLIPEMEKILNEDLSIFNKNIK